MNKTFSKFNTPISNNKIAGENIEYDHRYLELQRLSEGKPEQQYGDVIIDAQDPDWTQMEKLSVQLLSETKDLNVYCLYTQALTAKYGIEGFKNGCEIIYENLEKYWEDLYPKLVDEDEVFDPYYRINALSLLISNVGVVKQLYNAHLITNKLSNTSINVKQAINILQDKQTDEYAGGKERLILDLHINQDVNNSEIIELQEAYQLIEKIETIYNEKLENEQIPSFNAIKQPIITILNYINNSVNTIKQVEDVHSQIIEKSITDTTNINKESIEKQLKESQVWRNISLNNRKDVELVLEKICLYFETYEPSHPAPLFIRRIQKLMNMDFYEIVQEINPDSLSTLDILIGSRNIEQ